MLDFLFRRAVVPFPKYNTSEFTTLDGIPYNLTSLKFWNYTLYSNRTISNDSNCVLLFGNYSPQSMFLNGSWVNGTSCYNPILKIGSRGFVGIPFAAIFGVIIILALAVLRKHGQHMLPELKRFRGVGRRWPWYFVLFSAACGMISCIVGIDIDRSYVQYLPIILSGFFFCLMTPATFAAVWEMTRHWGSWQLRQIVDRDVYAFREEDRRAKFEFFIPMVFYLFVWMYFFMTIPRSWTPIQLQRSPEQTAQMAIPNATDGRFKASVVMLIICWLITVSSMLHSLKYYRPTNPGPTKMVVCLLLLAVKIGYLGAMSSRWEISMFNAKVNVAWPFAFGFLPDVLVMIVMLIASGIGEDNEDLQLIRQRRSRDSEADQEMGFTPKPKWWDLGKTDAMGRHLTREERLRAFGAPHSGFDLRRKKKNKTREGGLEGRRGGGDGGMADIQLEDLSGVGGTASTGVGPGVGGIGSGSSTGSDRGGGGSVPPPPVYREREEGPKVRSMLDI